MKSTEVHRYQVRRSQSTFCKAGTLRVANGKEVGAKGRKKNLKQPLPNRREEQKSDAKQNLPKSSGAKRR